MGIMGVEVQHIWRMLEESGQKVHAIMENDPDFSKWDVQQHFTIKCFFSTVYTSSFHSFLPTFPNWHSAHVSEPVLIAKEMEQGQSNAFWCPNS